MRRAEELGFSAVWQADSRLVREATVPMAAFAATTERIAVGSGSSTWDPQPRPAGVAVLHAGRPGPGRILAGLGAWWDPLATKVGIARESPLSVMREVVEAVRPAALRRSGHFAGDYVHLDGVELDYVYQERRPRPCRCTSAPPACG